MPEGDAHQDGDLEIFSRLLRIFVGGIHCFPAIGQTCAQRQGQSQGHQKELTDIRFHRKFGDLGGVDDPKLLTFLLFFQVDGDFRFQLPVQQGVVKGFEIAIVAPQGYEFLLPFRCLFHHFLV